MVDLFFFRVCFVVCFADTLGDHLGVALAMASIFAVGTLHSCSVFQEVAAKSTAHDIVELLRDELVTLLLVNLFLLLSDGTLAIETNIEWPSVLQLLGCPCVSILEKVYGDSFLILPKLIVRWMRPTGSSANQESIDTWPPKGAPGASP